LTTKTRDLTSSLAELLAWRVPIHEAARMATAKACGPHSTLHDAVCRLLDADKSKESGFRLLPIPILAALLGEPERALPVCSCRACGGPEPRPSTT
jgi:hypothetical protein